MDPSFTAAAVVAQLPSFKPVTEAVSFVTSLNHFVGFLTRQLIVVAAAGRVALLRPLTESSFPVVGYPPQQHHSVTAQPVCSGVQVVPAFD